MNYQRNQLTIPSSSLKKTKMCSKTLEIYDRILNSQSKGKGKMLPGSYSTIPRPKNLEQTGMQSKSNSDESFNDFTEERSDFRRRASYGERGHFPMIPSDDQKYSATSSTKAKRLSLPYKKSSEGSFNAAQNKLRSEIEQPQFTHPHVSQSQSSESQRPVPVTRIPSLPSFQKKTPIRPREKYISGKFSPTALDMVIGALKAGGPHYQRGMHYDDIMDLIKTVYNIPQTHQFNSSLKNALAQLVAKGSIAKSFGSKPEDALYRLKIVKTEPEISMAVCGKAVPAARNRWPTGYNLSVTGTNSFHSRPPATSSVSLPNLLPSFSQAYNNNQMPSHARNPHSIQLPPIEHVPYAGTKKDPMITQSFATRAGASAMRLKPDIERRPNTPDSASESLMEFDINSTMETYLGTGVGIGRGEQSQNDEFDEEYDFNSEFELDNLCKVFPRSIKSSGSGFCRKETVAEALSTSNIIPKELQSFGFGDNEGDANATDDWMNNSFASTGTGEADVNEEYEDVEFFDEEM